MRPVGAVNLKEFLGRKTPWRAQWREKIVDATGTRTETRSQWFKEKADADTFKAAHEGEGQRYEEIAMSATDRARWWRLNEDARRAGYTVEHVLAAGIAALKNKVAHTEPLETAWGLWLLDARDRKLRWHSVDSMKRAVEPFMKGREEIPVEAFVGRDLLLWVAAKYPASQESRDDVLGRLVTFFRWCAAEPRVWCRIEVWTGVKFAHKVKKDRGRIGFYDSLDTRAILHALPDHCKCAGATGFFLGVRPIELQRLMLEHTHKGEFFGFDEDRREWYIAEFWAKTRAYRKLYALPECWWYWWIRYKDCIDEHAPQNRKKQAKQKGKLVPMNYRNFKRVLSAARKRAGVKKNPKDGIRHSFGTHGYHRTKDGERGLEWCLDMLGHESDLSVFKGRYQGKVSDREAEAYYLIFPEGAACELKTRARVIVDGAGAITHRGPPVPRRDATA